MGVEAVDTRDPSAVAFFVSDLCQEADLIYRFGYTLTLSEVAAGRLVRETFRAILGQLSRFLEYSSQKIRLELMSVAWGIFQDWNESFKETDTPVLDFLYALKIEARIILVMVDILGLSEFEVQTILGLKEIELKRFLAEGRREMLNLTSS